MANNGSDKVVSVGHDDGHYCHKLAIEPGAIKVCPVTNEPLPKDQVFQFDMPSRVAVGCIIGNAEIETDDTNIYEVEYMVGNERITQRFTVIGNEQSSLPIEDTRSNDFPVSGAILALVHHALYSAGLGGRKVHIATGLPYNRFYMPGGVRNEALIKAKTDHLLNAKVRNLNPNVKLAEIVEHTVVPEGLAAHFDMLFDDQGGVNEEYAENINEAPYGFIDIGGNTTDVVVIQKGGESFDPVRSFTLDAGGLHAEGDIENALRIEFNLEGGYVLPRLTMEKLARSGIIRLRGKNHDMREKIVEPALRSQAFRIVNEIKAKMKGADDLDGVMLIGGGSILLSKHLKTLLGDRLHVVEVEHGHFANARGMLKRIKYING